MGNIISRDTIGDLSKFDEDGYLYVVDRKNDMIKTGGENVASREVEEVLYQHPAVETVSQFLFIISSKAINLNA